MKDLVQVARDHHFFVSPSSLLDALMDVLLSDVPEGESVRLALLPEADRLAVALTVLDARHDGYDVALDLCERMLPVMGSELPTLRQAMCDAKADGSGGWAATDAQQDEDAREAQDAPLRPGRADRVTVYSSAEEAPGSADVRRLTTTRGSLRRPPSSVL